MQEAKTNLIVMNSRLNKFIVPALILFFLFLTGFIYYRVLKAETSSPVLIALSQSTLESQYGLKINLISLTAAGGLVDLRLKIVDGEKAKKLLEEKDNFPALHISDGNITLNASEDTRSQEIHFENGMSLFLLYPNAGNAIKPGSFVSVRFGDVALEPIEVR